jgi:TatA/E family protein of Tat protein translocase
MDARARLGYNRGNIGPLGLPECPLGEKEFHVFGLHPNEIIFTLLIALLLFGPKKLPELARGMGQAIREFRTATSETAKVFQETQEEAPREQRPAPPPAPAKPAAAEAAPVVAPPAMPPAGTVPASTEAPVAASAPAANNSTPPPATDEPRKAS